jgi:hypothetical protein
VPDFLFIFGYESPEEWHVNQSQGTDFESSSAVWIVASDPEEALRAGHSFADRWVNDLFLKQGIETYPGWAASGFAHWIEHEPLQRFSRIALEMLDRIEA